MSRHLSNSAYGVLDYAAHPVAMLLVAPMLLRGLGMAQYGVWVIATAAVSTGGIVAAGFGDANIQYVAGARNRKDAGAMLRAVRSMVGINLVLGTAVGLSCWGLSPIAARHIAPSDESLQRMCLWSLRIASALMLVRAIESVCISTQRAFERYGAAVRISIVVRLLTLAVAVVLTRLERGVVSVMTAMAVLLVLGTAAQLWRLQQLIGAKSLLPAFDRDATSALVGFGLFSWLLAVAGVVFTQVDRLIVGVSLGATVVTSYALCVQMAQPIYGVASAALHFLFPYLSARRATTPVSMLRKPILKAFAVNLLLVGMGTAVALVYGGSFLRMWVGAAVAQNADAILAPIVWGFALLGLNVTAYFALLALGRVRIVTCLNLVGGVAMLAGMVCLVPRAGVHGLAMARLGYGTISLLMYYPLVRLMYRRRAAALPSAGAASVCEPIWEDA
jgi:O-antigen/teichoic acid export membrane protein